MPQRHKVDCPGLTGFDTVTGRFHNGPIISLKPASSLSHEKIAWWRRVKGEAATDKMIAEYHEQQRKENQD